MKYGNVYRILIIIALAAIVLSLSMRFFRRNPEENKNSIAAQTETAIESEGALTEETEKSQETMATYPDEVEAEGGNTQPEIYSPWEEEDYTACYFTNTENTIDVDSTLPVGAQGRLTDDAQRYLDSEGIKAIELRCIDGTVITEGPETSFQVQCDDVGKTIIVMTYNRNLHTWTFKRE